MMTIYPSEHDEQKALIKWARSKGIELLFAIPNGGYRAISVAKRLKAEGVKARSTGFIFSHTTSAVSRAIH